MRPVDAQWPVSQEFGAYATQGVVGDPNGSEVQQLVAAYGNYQPYGHAGQDIGCPIGTPVHAIADGTVLWADWGTNLPGDESDWGYRQRWYLYKTFPGIVTVIQHDGWKSVYAHQSSNDVITVGQQVQEGELIGYSGNTKAPGVTLGAHLHVEALVDDSYTSGSDLIYGRTNPEPYYGATVLANAITPTEEDTLSAEEVTQIQNFIADRLGAVMANIDSIPGRVLATPVEWMGFDGKVQPDGARHTTSLATFLGWDDAGKTSLANLSLTVAKQVAAIPAATAGAAPAIDVEALATALASKISEQQAHQLIIALGAQLNK